jgi:hypothetical protein
MVAGLIKEKGNKKGKPQQGNKIKEITLITWMDGSEGA